MKLPLKGGRFQTIDEIKENTTEQLVVISKEDFANLKSEREIGISVCNPNETMKWIKALFYSLNITRLDISKTDFVNA